MIPFLLVVIGSFFLGSIPFGLIVAKAKGIDIREVGSGNIGATNVARALGKKAGFFVLFLDALKGALPALVGGFLVSQPPFDLSVGTFFCDLSMICGFVAVLGHIFSPFLRFKGGKGIATGLGMLIGASPVIAGLALGGFLIVVAILRYVSLGSIFSVIVMVVSGHLLLPGRAVFLIAYWIIALFIVFRHRDNIKRLISGEEKKFSFSSNVNKSG